MREPHLSGRKPTFAGGTHDADRLHVVAEQRHRRSPSDQGRTGGKSGRGTHRSRRRGRQPRLGVRRQAQRLPLLRRHRQPRQANHQRAGPDGLRGLRRPPGVLGPVLQRTQAPQAGQARRLDGRGGLRDAARAAGLRRAPRPAGLIQPSIPPRMSHLSARDKIPKHARSHNTPRRKGGKEQRIKINFLSCAKKTMGKTIVFFIYEVPKYLISIFKFQFRILI